MPTTRKTQKPKPAPVSDFESQLVDISEVEDHVKALTYGRSGTGKTTLCGTFPKPLLYLDVRDKGTKSIRGQQGIKVATIETWDQFLDAYWFLKNNPDKFKTVVVDNITQLQDLCLKHVKGGKDTVSKTSQQAWGGVAENMKAWLLNFRDLPIHVNFIAQDRMDSTDEDGDDDNSLQPEVGPQVIPSVAKILNGSVDIITQTFIRQREKKTKVEGKIKTTEVVEFCARIGPHPIFLTKFRRDPKAPGSVPPILVNPSYDKFVSIINGEEK